jgi:hypothetical protein
MVAPRPPVAGTPLPTPGVIGAVPLSPPSPAPTPAVGRVVPMPAPVPAPMIGCAMGAARSAGWIPADGSTSYQCSGCPASHLSRWDGAAWHDATPKQLSSLPTALAVSADPTSGGVLAMAGTLGWTVHGADVSLQHGDPALRLRNQPAMAEDPGHHDVVLFGGRVTGVPASDTWTWDGKAWTRRAGTTPPVPTAPPLPSPAARMPACTNSADGSSVLKPVRNPDGSVAIGIEIRLGPGCGATASPTDRLRIVDAYGALLDVQGNDHPLDALFEAITWSNWCGTQSPPSSCCAPIPT